LTRELWDRFPKKAYAIVREANPDGTLVIGPAFWGSIDYPDQLELPEEDRNIIVTAHYYWPGELTHQGAHWSQHKDLSGIE